MLSHALRVVVFVCFFTLVTSSMLAHANGSQRLIESEIKGENGRWAEAYARGDYSAIGDLYTDDGTLFPPGESRVVGPSAIADYFKKKFPNGARHTVAFDNLEFYGDDDTVTEISDTEICDLDGKLISRGRQTLVFLKKNGIWKLHRDMWNSTMLTLPR